MKKKLSLMIIGFLILAGGSLFGQDIQKAGKDKFTWVNLGLGAGSPIYYDTEWCIASVANLTFQTGKKVLSFRSAGGLAFMDANFSDLGVLYGRVIKSSSSLIIISAGLSLVSYADGGGSTMTVGIPLEIQFFSKKSHRIGYYGFANINAEKPIFGLCLCLRLGKLK